MNLQHTAAWPFPTEATWPRPTGRITPIVKKIEVLEWPELPEVEEVKIVHVVGEPGQGGVTIAYRKVNKFNNCKYVEAAVAYCSPFDTFSKKVGRRLALENWNSGFAVVVPARTNNDDHTIPENLRQMFWYSLGY